MVNDNSKSLIEIFVKYDNKNYKFVISKMSSVHSLKCMVVKRLLVEKLDYIGISYGGRLLKDDKSLIKYMILNGSTLEVYRKAKAGMGMFFKIIVFLLALFISLYLFPLILISGIIPFSVELIESFVVSGVKKILCWAPLSHKSLSSTSIGGFFKFLLKILKICFIYIGVYTIFGYAFLILEYAFHIFTASSNLFDRNNKKGCLSVHSAKMAATILTVFYLMYYFAFQTPNYIVNLLSCGANMSFLTKIIFSPALKFVQDIADEGKFGPIEMIPFLGEAAISYYVAIDGFIDVFEASLDDFISFGCNPDGSSINIDKISKKINDKRNRKKRRSSANPQTGIVSQTGTVPQTKITPTDYCHRNTSIEKKCCSSEMFERIGVEISNIMNNDLFKNELKSRGLDNWAELARKAFNTKWVNEGVAEFYNAPFFSKFQQKTIEPPLALLIRYLFCNTLELGKSALGTIDNIGTPFMIADSLKSGSATGILVIIIYFIAVIVLMILFIYRMIFK